jgi:hypothetical protein
MYLGADEVKFWVSKFFMVEDFDATDYKNTVNHKIYVS